MTPRMAESPRVLVVEDNQDVREMLRLQLGFAGYEVTCAEDGLEAIELLERFEPEVMLVDVVMPRLDGVGLTEHIRAQARYREVPLILLTGLDSSDDRVRTAMALPHVHHLAKGQSP
ncbi:MAG: response regulator, partial [Candidatus Dormibacteria bacterium]